MEGGGKREETSPFVSLSHTAISRPQQRSRGGKEGVKKKVREGHKSNISFFLLHLHGKERERRGKREP